LALVLSFSVTLDSLTKAAFSWNISLLLICDSTASGTSFRAGRMRQI
jgi:hypothetical protein